MSVCKIRLVQRCLSTAPLAVKVGRVYFRPTEAGVNGDGGWIGAEIKQALSDDGSLDIRFPNGQGSDGVLHLKRFAILTDPKYKVGEEWIQVHREGEKLMTVCSPASRAITPTEITLTCADQLAPLTLSRDEVLNPWCHPPRDVLDYYTRWELPYALKDFTDWSLTGTGTTPDGCSYGGASPSPGGGINLQTGVPSIASVSLASAPGANLTAWTVQFLGRIMTAGSYAFEAFGVKVRLVTLGATSSGQGGVIVTPIGGTPGPLRNRTDLIYKCPFALRIYRRGDWVFVSINGETVEVVRGGTPTIGSIIAATSATPSAGNRLIINQITASTVEQYLMSDTEPGDLHLPGAPTPGGLAGRYFLESDAKALCAPTYDSTTFAKLVHNPLQDEYANRVDQTVDFAVVDPPAWQPVGPAGGTWWSARWTGAIYLDLAAADRSLQVAVGAGDVASVWVGRRDGTASRAAYVGGGLAPGGASSVSGSLRSYLGQAVSGWYPIIIEYYHTTSDGGITLKDGPVGGPYTVVPAARLSPYGVFEDNVQHESHRAMLDRITQEFGYQWVVDPRSLESGQFPGRLIPRVRQGRDYDLTLTQDDVTGMSATASAADAAVRLLVDAAGLAAPDGAGSLTAEAWDIPAAQDALYISTGWEAAAEITNPALAQQRAASLQSLRAGPLEQVTANPTGERALVASVPLGPLTRAEWVPGDAPKLSIPPLGINDQSPRQLTVITWPVRPESVGTPQGSWRSRPRGQKTAGERGLQYAATAKRNYQGQIAQADGSMASNVSGWAASDLSWLSTQGHIIELRLNILLLTGGPATLVVNGLTVAGRVAAPDSIDVTDKLAASSVQQATVTVPAGGRWLGHLIARVTA